MRADLFQIGLSKFNYLVIKRFLIIILSVSFSLAAKNSNSQCTPNPTIIDSEGDGEISPDTITVYINSGFNETITIIGPDTANVGVGHINIHHLTIKTMHNKPAWLNYACNPSSCEISALNPSCILLTGTPPIGSAGYYNIDFTVDVYALILATPVLVLSDYNYFFPFVIAVHSSSTPPPPNVSSPVSYCQNDSAIPLTATGTNLLWYSSSIGGIGSAVAPTPNTSSPGTTTYYVSQTVNGYESPRASIDVTVKPSPNISIISSGYYILPGTQVFLSALGGQSYLWWPSTGLNDTVGSQVIATPYSNTTYHVRGIGVNGCESQDSVRLLVECDICPDSVLFAYSGTFSLGCGIIGYGNSSHCKWLLFPSGASKVFVSFDEFDILPGDKIRVWQGSDTTGVLKGAFDNNNRPPDSITTTVPMLVELITNSSDVASGFKANYWTDVNGSVNETSDFIKSFNLYPNPAGKLLNIDFTCKDNDIELIIYNILGQPVQNINMITADGIAKSIIDISTYPKGAYSVLIRGKNGNKAATFIIE